MAHVAAYQAAETGWQSFAVHSDSPIDLHENRIGRTTSSGSSVDFHVGMGKVGKVRWMMGSLLRGEGSLCCDAERTVV